MRRVILSAVSFAVGALALTAGLASGALESRALTPLPANAKFDYQISGDYPLPPGTQIVSRDWLAGSAAADPVYSICYVNAYQTQPDYRGEYRRDEASSWPRRLVLRRLGDDPGWAGEYLIDISSERKRRQAARWLAPEIRRCASKGFEAVELDNLDSWTRFNGTRRAGRVPFGKQAALDYARKLARAAHSEGLAVAQKNTTQITPSEAAWVGFDLAVAEECARWRECGRYTRIYGDDVVVIEYRRRDFERACSIVGGDLSVVLRDVSVSRPSQKRYVYDSC